MREKERAIRITMKNVLFGKGQLKDFIFFSLLFPSSHKSLGFLCSKAPSYHLPPLINLRATWVLLQKPLDCSGSQNTPWPLRFPSSSLLPNNTLMRSYYFFYSQLSELQKNTTSMIENLFSSLNIILFISFFIPSSSIYHQSSLHLKCVVSYLK